MAARFASIQCYNKSKLLYFSDNINLSVYKNRVQLDRFWCKDCEAEDSEDLEDSEKHNKADSVDEHE